MMLDGSRLINPDGEFRIDAVREMVASRLHLVPRFRQLLYGRRDGWAGRCGLTPRPWTWPIMSRQSLCRHRVTRHSSCSLLSYCAAAAWSGHDRCGRCGS